MNISFFKTNIGQAEIDAVVQVMQSGMIVEWNEVKKLENDFNTFITDGVFHPICLSNGTVALDLALKAVNIQPDDEVIVPNFTYIATANSIRFQNAKVVFADVDATQYNITLEEIQKVITPKTRAIIIVHLYGNPAKDAQKIYEYCKSKNIWLIEDCAQSHGAMIDEKKAGSFGDISCFSFYATKNMSTSEGWITLFRHQEHYEKAKLYYNHGQKEKYYHTALGHNFRMTNIAAAIGNVQLWRLAEFNDQRRKNAFLYNTLLQNQDILQLPETGEWIFHVYHQYTVLVKKDSPISRETIQKKLQEKWIPTAIHYPITIKNQPYYQDLWYIEGEHSTSYYLSQNIFSLPIYPGLTEEEVRYIAQSLLEIIQ